MIKSSESTLKIRHNSLDWIRGLMALSIMIYHFGSYNDVSHPVSRLGIYGVSIFFILSGLSMGIAYDKYICDIRTSLFFFIRRLFRIWPLLWFAVALVAIPTYIFGEGPYGAPPYSFLQILLNILTLAGFSQEFGYINVGAWSIGNEMIYYMFTPFLIIVYHWKKEVGNLLTTLCALITIYFSFFVLHPSDILSSQFYAYTNPFNNIFLYCSGLAIYYNSYNLKIQQQWYLPFLIFSSSLLFLYPVSGDQIHIVTGHIRIIMIIASIFIVLAFYKYPPESPKYISHFLTHLGMTSYGIYLLHPIVAWYVGSGVSFLEQFFALQKINYFRTLISIPLTIFIAQFTYRYLESPLIDLGKRFTAIKPT